MAWIECAPFINFLHSNASERKLSECCVSLFNWCRTVSKADVRACARSMTLSSVILEHYSWNCSIRAATLPHTSCMGQCAFCRGLAPPPFSLKFDPVQRSNSACIPLIGHTVEDVRKAQRGCCSSEAAFVVSRETSEADASAEYSAFQCFSVFTT